MLTRAFLLLLAMMTGLSAAQAADVSRPVAERVAVTKSIVQLVHDRADSYAARVIQVARFSDASVADKWVVRRVSATLISNGPTPCVQRSDRRRE